MSEEITEVAAVEAEKAKPGRKPKADGSTVAVKILRDYWNDKEERVSAGTIVEVPVDVALKGVQSGAFAPVS
ncbi:MAG: hypothetical protein ACRCUC_12830 [Aestuariivirga sp.]